MMNKYPIELQGCTGGGCIFQDNSKGMHTGGCRCEKELRRHPEGLKAVRMIHALRNEIENLAHDKKPETTATPLLAWIDKEIEYNEFNCETINLDHPDITESEKDAWREHNVALMRLNQIRNIVAAYQERGFLGGTPTSKRPQAGRVNDE